MPQAGVDVRSVPAPGSLPLGRTRTGWLVLCVGVLVPAPADIQADQQRNRFDLESATIPEINAAFDSGALTSVGLVELYLARIDAYDLRGPALNAVIVLNPHALELAAALDEERAASGPRSPLHGIPVLVKDNFNTVDMPTTAGSVALAGSIPPSDAFAVERLREAGAIILGKVNLSEFATPAGQGAYNSLSGITRNPHNLRRDPGSSSGGTAAAVSANFAPVGLGTDTGGSIRGPAAATGLVGIRPTFGLVSRHGIIPQVPSLDVGGPLARSVTDVAITLGVIAGPDPRDPATMEEDAVYGRDYAASLDGDALDGARLGVLRDFFGGHPDVDRLVEGALDDMRALGASIVDPIRLDPQFFELMGGLRANLDAEFKPALEAYLATLPDGFPRTLEEVIARYEADEVVSSPTPVNPGLIASHVRKLEIGGWDHPGYVTAMERDMPLVRETVVAILDEYDLDALIYPTSRCPARPIFNIEDSSFTCEPGPSGVNIASYSGFPDVQVPVGFSADGLPATISFVGRAYTEANLLAYAYAYEQATGHLRLPSTVPPLPGESF